MGLGCCKIESLPQAKTSISHAQVAGAFPGLQPWTDYATRYEELQLVATTSVSTRSRVTEIRANASGLRYVCRRCPYDEAPLHDEPEALALHLEAMCELDHPHLCKLVECFTDPESGDYLLVSEQAHQPTLLDYVEEHGLPNGDIDAADCVRQILSALALGHSRGIAHGRLRHDCILVTSPTAPKDSPPSRHSERKSTLEKEAIQTGLAPQVKICDMGLGYALRDPISLATANYEGILYMPPEHAWAEYELDQAHQDPVSGSEEPLLKAAITKELTGESAEAVSENALGTSQPVLAIEDSKPKNHVIPLWSAPKGGAAPPGADKVDVWAVGVLTFNLLSGALPFEASDEEQLAGHLRAHRPKFSKDPWSDIPAKAYNAVDMMLKLNPDMRPSAIDMLRHPWLRLTRKKVSKTRMYNLYRNAIVNLQEGQFKKMVNRIVAEQLSNNHAHKQEALEVFRALDKDRDGLLNMEEFVSVLQKLPNLDKFTDAELLFEAADRNRSGTLDANEFMATTLPPSEARGDKNLWDAFRAFDRNESGSITLDEVSSTLKLLEGPLMPPEQMDELDASIRDELETLGFGSNLLVNLGLHDHDDESSLGKFKDRMSGLMPCGGRRLDFGEFVYLCSTRARDFKTPSWAKKEAYRCVDLCCDVDMYHQAHRTGTRKWPPLAGAYASTTVSVYEKKGLAGDSEKRKQSRAKSGHRYSTAAAHSARHGGSARPDGTSARVSGRGSTSHARKSQGGAHFAPTHHGHHFHHHDEHGHPHHGVQGEHHHHHHHGDKHHHSSRHRDDGSDSPHWSPGDDSGRGSARPQSARGGSGRNPHSGRDPAKESGRTDSRSTNSSPPQKKKPRKPSDYDSEAESDEHEEEED